MCVTKVENIWNMQTHTHWKIPVGPLYNIHLCQEKTHRVTHTLQTHNIVSGQRGRTFQSSQSNLWWAVCFAGPVGTGTDNSFGFINFCYHKLGDWELRVNKYWNYYIHTSSFPGNLHGIMNACVYTLYTKSCVCFFLRREGICAAVAAAVAAAAEFPGKSEHIQKEKEGGWWGVQINKFVEKGRGAGKRIRREEGDAVRRKKGKGRQSFWE